MTNDRPVEALNARLFFAEEVRQRLEVFPEKFRELGEGGTLRDLLQTPHTLPGPLVEQEPEDFTEQYLIEPVLDGLGYLNPVSEDYSGSGPHFVRRPSTFKKIEVKRPDYLLKNVSPKLVCILEAKAANNEHLQGSKRKATDDIEEYVESNTFAKYLESRDKQYLVAIGTDGLRWVLWAKDVRSGKTKEALAEVSLSPVMKSIARRKAVIEGDPEQETAEIRYFLANEFIPIFSARWICEFIQDKF